MKGLYIEVDGYISCGSGGGDAAAGGLGALMGNLMGSLGSSAAEKWVPCKKWIHRNRVEEVTYEDHDIKLKAARPQPQLRMVREGEEEREPAAEEPKDEYAPGGWWVHAGFPNGTRYHLANQDDGKKLVAREEEGDVAAAVLRLAEEIALKPSSIPGAEVTKLQQHFQGEQIKQKHFQSE